MWLRLEGTELQIYRMVEVGGTSGDDLVQALLKPESARTSWSRSCDFEQLELDISSDGDSITCSSV